MITEKLLLFCPFFSDVEGMKDAAETDRLARLRAAALVKKWRRRRVETARKLGNWPSSVREAEKDIRSLAADLGVDLTAIDHETEADHE